MWSYWLVFCNYGFSVSALWCPLTTPTIFWVSLSLDMGYLFMATPAKHSHCSLPWTRGVSSSELDRYHHGMIGIVGACQSLKILQQSAHFCHPPWWSSSQAKAGFFSQPNQQKWTTHLSLPLQGSLFFRFLDHFRSFVSAVFWFLCTAYFLHLI